MVAGGKRLVAPIDCLLAAMLQYVGEKGQSTSAASARWEAERVASPSTPGCTVPSWISGACVISRSSRGIASASACAKTTRFSRGWRT